MSILTGKRIRNLVESMIDPEIQTQMCGIDLTLQRAERFISAGTLAYENSERKLPETEEMEFDQFGWLSLEQGPYLITFNEIVNIPKNMAAFARPRSSLLRSGATMETALWDPGYRGRSQSLLIVYNQAGLRMRKNSRLLQLIFMNLDDEADKTYSGIYQGENIF